MQRSNSSPTQTRSPIASTDSKTRQNLILNCFTGLPESSAQDASAQDISAQARFSAVFLFHQIIMIRMLYIKYPNFSKNKQLLKV
jgi:hypothetical protein